MSESHGGIDAARMLHLRPPGVDKAVVAISGIADEVSVVAGHGHQEGIARVRLLYFHLPQGVRSPHQYNFVTTQGNRT